MAKKVYNHMSQQDNEDWDALYEYVRHNVLNYDSNQSLSKSMVLRLKGLLKNKFMASNKISNTANYSFKTVLNTFKFCFPEIKKGLQSNSFRDENHKFNYIIKIVENNLNTVYIRMKQAEKTKEDVVSNDAQNDFDYVNTFKVKENSSNNKKLDDLW